MKLMEWWPNEIRDTLRLPGNAWLPMVRVRENYWVNPSPRTNWFSSFHKDDGSYTATIELPGAKPEEVKTTVKDGVVRVSAKYTKGNQEVDIDRSFSLPSDVDQSSAKATLENGLLTIDFAVKDEARDMEVKIN